MFNNLKYTPASAPPLPRRLPAIPRTVLACMLALGWAVEVRAQDLAADRKVLEALYNATGGPDWTDNTNWLSNEPLSQWHGVFVAANGRVRWLHLSNNQLTGAIPKELGNLASLERLDLRDNQLTRAIPAELGNLANLEVLLLSYQELTEAIPELTYTIPKELGNLANLELLDLSGRRTGNQLTGAIPKELGNLASLKWLDLRNNQFTGSLPAELGNLANLEWLYLFNNQLTGSLPAELGNLVNLERLLLYDNQLTGPIPAELGNLANLVQLYLRDNQFTGTLPAELGNLANLEVLDLSNNQLTGTIPESFTNLGALSGFSFYLNPGLCAQDDSAIRAWLDGVGNVEGPDCTPAVRLSINPSSLFEGSGATPVTVTATRQAVNSSLLVIVELGGSARKGAGRDYTVSGSNVFVIPANAASGTTRLTFTPLEDGLAESDENIILQARTQRGGEFLGYGESVTLPLIDSARACAVRGRAALEALYNATGGVHWTRRANWLSDQPLSDWHGVTLDSNGCVTDLQLPGNQLTGVIPAELGNLANLELLSLSNNRLTGAIPAELGNLANLEWLYLSNNRLTGAIPTELGNLANLQRLSLSGNQLTGAIPASFTNLGAVEFFSFYGNANLVVPGDAAMQAWLEGIETVQGPGYLSPEPTSSHFVPVILTASGRNRSFFTSELTLTNRGSRTATLQYTYTAAAGGGSGQASETLAPGRQKIVPDAIDYLRTLDVPIPGSGNRIGTLRVAASGSEVGVTVRTTTAVANGRAGLAYQGVAVADGFTEAVYLCGLRQNARDRSNVAFQNMGTSEEGSITLRATVFSGDPSTPGSRVLPDVTLAPGGFHQYSGLLGTAGIDQGWVRVERVSGTAPFYAYGVINDQANSDGSLIFPVTASSLSGVRGQTLPVIIEHPNFSTELIVTNFSNSTRRLNLYFVADAIPRPDKTASFEETDPIGPGEQWIIPDVVNEELRKGIEGIGPGGAIAGAAFFEAAGGDLSGVVIGARTGSPGGGGQYSVFYNAVPYGAAFIDSAWVYALQQNAENRSNLALVNTGEVDGSDSVFELEIYDGDTGDLVNTVTGIRVPVRGWRQINAVLGNYAQGTSQGYVRVRKTSGGNPFLAYGVINDGGAPGQRSDDGAYVPAQP